MGPRIVVVGGGLAGLSAALSAADSGAGVTLLESRPRLGGATWSFQRNGVWFDNGQHVFMRCCTAYRSFLSRIGATGGVYLQPRLEVPVLCPGTQPGVISRVAAPAPFHLLPSLLTYPHLSPLQRLSVLRTASFLRRLNPDDPSLDRMSFGGWLERRGEDSQVIDDFWNLIVLPSVNVHARGASLKLAAKVFVTGLLTDSKAADIGWPRIPLAELHADHGRRALEAAGVEVLTGSGVDVVRRGADGGLEVVAGGGCWSADAVVVAVPHERVASLFPPAGLPDVGRLTHLGHSPIVNIHLVYDLPVMELPLAAAVRSDVQYVFDRTESSGLDDGRQCLAISLSAADEWVGMPSSKLVAHFTSEMARLLPAARRTTVSESMVTREQTATFLGVPGSDALRAGVSSGITGVFLAGAWCATGWPATMEGAVRSGVSAAREALASCGLRAPLGGLAAIPGRSV